MQTIKKVSLSAINDFVEKNNGECVDFVDGSLLDNMVFRFDFGTLFCFEEYQNQWSSCYVLQFFHKDRARGINKAWERFNNLKHD